jgi:hypothetical protein
MIGGLLVWVFIFSLGVCAGVGLSHPNSRNMYRAMRQDQKRKSGKHHKIGDKDWLRWCEVSYDDPRLHA